MQNSLNIFFLLWFVVQFYLLSLNNDVEALPVATAGFDYAKKGAESD
jgi:hypothetical protein